MKRNVLAYLLLLVLLLTACGRWQKTGMLRQLNELQAMNQADSLLTNDSLAKALASYFDDYGTPNERMLAHYLLARTYTDMGEAPQAIDEFQEAIKKADTAQNDCNYYTLSCAYSQMADQYHRQLLPTYELEARRQAIRFALIAQNALLAAYELGEKAGAHIMIGEKDSAEIYSKKAIRLFSENGYRQQSLQTSIFLLHLYVEQPSRMADARQLIDTLESQWDQFDAHHELHASNRLYYYYKGRYYEGISMLDSAEHYYRKMYYPGMSFLEQDPMYRGLLSVYRKRHIADSIAKYAQLFGMANDSSVAVKDQNLTAQMAASYQYRSFQQLAQQKEREANEVRIVLTLLIAAVIILFMLGIFLWLRYRERQRYRLQTMRKEYADATHSYNQNLHTLQVLQDSHKSIIQQMQQELSSSEAENRHYREKKNQLEQLTAQYETEHHELVSENSQLKARIEQLRQQLNPQPDAASSTLFGDTPIAQRIAELHDMPQIQLTDAEKEALVLAASQHFPDMVQALRQAKDIDQEGAVICILVALNQKPGDIRNMLNLSFQQVSNQKSAINTTLFGDSSARSLYKNLINHFAIYQG